jgi:hypothetical protein
MEKLGRLNASEMELVIHDAPEKTVRAILTKQDEILAKLNLIATAIETATDAATLYTELDTAEIKAQLSEVNLFL